LVNTALHTILKQVSNIIKIAINKRFNWNFTKVER